MTPKIIFQDDSLLVLDKPAGLVVDRSETQIGTTLEDWVDDLRGNDKLLRVGIVHRLDKDTSGLILVAKTVEALENLQSQFQTRIVKKEYLALVHGSIESPGKIEGNIGRNPGNRVKFTVLKEGKKATTEYKPIKLLSLSSEFIEKTFKGLSGIQLRKLRTMNYGIFTLVACRPLTGRTHQIRVHLKYKGHPIVGDEKYLGRKMYRLDHRWCARQFLHAAKIGFNHPETGKWMEFESPLPVDLENVLNLLEK